MHINTIELLINLLFLAFSSYLYLYAAGILNVKTPDLREKQTQVMNTSGRWLRPLCLALAAFSLINLIMIVLGM